MASIVKSSFAFRSRLLSSSLQLLINYRELKQLELQRCTINKHSLHDATRGPHNRKTAKQISRFKSHSFSFIFSSCSPLPQEAFHKYTHKQAWWGQVFQFIRQYLIWKHLCVVGDLSSPEGWKLKQERVMGLGFLHLSPSQSHNLQTSGHQQLPHSQGRNDAGEPRWIRCSE